MNNEQSPETPSEIQNEAPLDQNQDFKPDPGPEPGPTLPTVYRFSLIMAEVIFTCELGLQSRRTQFISKSTGETFPRSRLLQLQQLAASHVIAELKMQSNGAIKKAEVEAVYLLGQLDCGWMTEEDFLHSETTLVAAGEIPSAENTPPADASNNVVPLHHPD